MITENTNIVVPQRNLRGFTIPEVIVGVALLGILLLLSVGLVRAAKRLMPGATRAVAGVNLPVAPSASAYADAVRLHGTLIERINDARAVYVFGGSHAGLPASASRVAGGPLAAERLPRIGDFGPGLPLDAYEFYARYAEALGPRETTFDPADFSVVTIGWEDHALMITGLAQVRGERISISDGDVSEVFVRREAVLYDAAADTMRYAFLEPVRIADLASVGARHFWYRYAEGKVAEEGPVLAIFPDPWLYAGTRVTPRGDGLPPVSQFMYFLAVSP